MNIKYSLIVLLLGALLFQGCAAVRPFPTAARSGDTITLAVGSLDGANEGNLTVNFTTADSTVVDLTPNIRSVFNVYPDKTSHTWLANTGANLETDFLSAMSGHSPWLTVVALDLPILPIGQGVINISTGEDIVQPLGSYPLSNLNIELEVLPGTGSSNTFEYMASQYNSAPISGNLNNLKPKRQILIRGEPGIGNYFYIANQVCAAEFVVYAPAQYLANPSATIPDEATFVIHDVSKFDISAKTQMSWLREGDNIKIMFISPTCTLRDRMIRFSILSDIYSGYEFTGTPSLMSTRYFNESGEEISGYAPELVLINF